MIFTVVVVSAPAIGLLHFHARVYHRLKATKLSVSSFSIEFIFLLIFYC